MLISRDNNRVGKRRRLTLFGLRRQHLASKLHETLNNGRTPAKAVWIGLDTKFGADHIPSQAK